MMMADEPLVFVVFEYTEEWHEDGEDCDYIANVICHHHDARKLPRIYRKDNLDDRIPGDVPYFDNLQDVEHHFEEGAGGPCQVDISQIKIFMEISDKDIEDAKELVHS